MKKYYITNIKQVIYLHRKKKIKKKAPFKNINKYIMGTVILLYIISRMPPFLSQAVEKIYVAEYGKIESVVSAVGYVARNEKIIKSLRDEEISLFVNEGDRVRKGQKIASIYYDNLDEKISRDLEIINLRINSIKSQQSNQQFFQGDIEKLEKEINSLGKDIQGYIKDGEFDKAYLSKDQLLLLTEKKSIIKGEKSFSGKNLDQLLSQQKDLDNRLNDSVEVLYSEFSGFVVLGSDGLEELLSIENLDGLSLHEYKSLANIVAKSKDNLDNQETHLKIVETHRWNIVTSLKGEEFDGLEEGDSVKIRQGGESIEYNACVKKIIHETKEENIVIFELTEFMDDWYNKRVIHFDIIKSSFDGIMIPNNTIVEMNNQQGVLRLDINGYCVFVPIKIKGSNNEHSIIYNGYFEDDDANKINTINYYDEIVDSRKIKEGDKIR